MILTNSFMILEKMRSCLWKLELWFWAYSLIRVLAKALGPNCPKLVLKPQTPNLTALRCKKFFMSSFIKFCMKQTLIFKFYVTFDEGMSVCSRKIVKKPHQNSSFWCHSRHVSFPQVLSENTPFFGALKFKYLRNRLVNFKK